MNRVPGSFRWLVLLLALAGPRVALGDTPPERQKEVAELEKKLADLKAQLANLKDEKPKAAAAPTQKKAIELADMASWKSVRASALANNGEWFAYRVAPAEGDSEVVVRQVKGTKEYKFAAGGPGGPAGVPAQLAAFIGGGATFSFSADSKWFVFTINPPAKPAPAGFGPQAPTTKTVLLSLASGEKTEFENIRRAAFSGESATHLALQKNPSTSTR